MIVREEERSLGNKSVEIDYGTSVPHLAGLIGSITGQTGQTHSTRCVRMGSDPLHGLRFCSGVKPIQPDVWSMDQLDRLENTYS
jgi:hypothetical protein